MSFANADGVRIHYELLGTGGPRVVMAHGLGANLESQFEWAEIAADQGCEILVYSARGHGQSSPVDDPGGYTFDQLQRDLGALLDEVGWNRCVMAGGSMGAATVLAFALASPERTRGLVQLAPAFGEAPPFLVGQGFALVADLIESEGARGAIEILLKRVPAVLGPAADNEKLLAELIETWSSHEPKSIAAAMRGVPGQLPFETIEDLRKISVPTLIVASENDPLHPLDVARRYAELIPDAQMIEVPLDPPITQDPRKFATLITEFAHSLPRDT